MSLAHGRGHFVRAIMESVAFMLRKNLALLPALGIEVDEIRSLGGGAKSALWNQIKADVTGKPIVTIRSAEAACVGVAMLAAVATGIHASLEDASKAMVSLADRYEPAPDARESYDPGYRTYLDMYDALYDVFRAGA